MELNNRSKYVGLAGVKSYGNEDETSLVQVMR